MKYIISHRNREYNNQRGYITDVKSNGRNFYWEFKLNKTTNISFFSLKIARKLIKARYINDSDFKIHNMN